MNPKRPGTGLSMDHGATGTNPPWVRPCEPGADAATNPAGDYAAQQDTRRLLLGIGAGSRRYHPFFAHLSARLRRPLRLGRGLPRLRRKVEGSLHRRVHPLLVAGGSDRVRLRSRGGRALRGPGDARTPGRRNEPDPESCYRTPEAVGSVDRASQRHSQSATFRVQPRAEVHSRTAERLPLSPS